MVDVKKNINFRAKIYKKKFFEKKPFLGGAKGIRFLTLVCAFLLTKKNREI